MDAQEVTCILTSISIILGIIYFFIHLIISKRKKTLELLNYFSKELIPKTNQIYIKLQNTPFQNKINKYTQEDCTKLKDFTTNELRNISKNNSIITELENLLFKEIYKENKNSFNIRYAYDKFMCEMTNYINDLEWFSLNLNKRLASKHIAYPCINTAFIGIVNILYFYIIYGSIDKNTKYKNIIKLYNKWTKKYFKSHKIKFLNTNYYKIYVLDSKGNKGKVKRIKSN